MKPGNRTGVWSYQDDGGIIGLEFEFISHRRSCNRWTNQKLRPASRNRLSWKLEKNTRTARAVYPRRNRFVMASTRVPVSRLMFLPRKNPGRPGSVSASEPGTRLDAMGRIRTSRPREIPDLAFQFTTLSFHLCDEGFSSVIFSSVPMQRRCGFTSC